jgi:DNA-binding transcriptional MerR regulator
MKIYYTEEVVNILGIYRKTLYNWEKNGRIPKPKRDSISGYRYWTADDLKQLQILTGRIDITPNKLTDYSDKVKKNDFSRNIPPKLRFKILQRDNFTCQYCGRNRKIHQVVLWIDHIIPVSKGGLTIESNLITSCLDCNLGKSNSILLNSNLFCYRRK